MFSGRSLLNDNQINCFNLIFNVTKIANKILYLQYGKIDLIHRDEQTYNRDKDRKYKLSGLATPG